MGIYDLPAALNFVSKAKNNSKVIYIGHSMGTTMSYVFASERPELAEKLVSAIFSLAPIAYLNHAKTPAVYLAPYYKILAVNTAFLCTLNSSPSRYFHF